MTSYWKKMAQDAGSSASGIGGWPRRAAEAVGAQAEEGRSWVQRIVRGVGAQQSAGPYARRLLPPGAASGRGSWEKQLYLGSYDYYVSSDATIASDSNSGRSPSSPFLTIAHALSVIGSRAGARLGLACNSKFREHIASAAVGLVVGFYGLGAAPQLLGSVDYSAATWSLVTGTEYSTDIAYTPLNVFRVVGVARTRLAAGTSGALTLNQKAVSGGKLHVNIGRDPTGENIEVSASYDGNNNNSANSGLFVSADGQKFFGLDVLFWNTSNLRIVADGVRAVSCTFSCGAQDGVDVVSGAGLDNVVAYCTIKLNGQGRTGTSGPGDGVSAHATTGILVDHCDIQDNDLTGVGNENSAKCTVRYCYLRGNYWNRRVYANGTADRGFHADYYNLIVVAAVDQGNAVRLEALSPGGYDYLCYNNTIYFESDPAGSTAISCSSGDSVLLSNIIAGCHAAIANFNGFSGRTCTVNSDRNKAQTSVSLYQSGFAPTVAGAHDLKTNILFRDAAAGNFGLQDGSPALAAGTPLGFAVDLAGKKVSTTAPSAGCYERVAA